MARHVNIPIFIPHEGCRNECVFCNQRTITGVNNRCDEEIPHEIDKALETVEADAEVEIAFFGGSFTGIGMERMTRLCDIAYGYVKQGRVQSVRLSTRPDYIDSEILAILRDRGVTHIELGIQSASDKVLAASKRGHTFAHTERACSLINDGGFILGGQMMVGLPCSDLEDEIYTAKQLVSLGCREARIYPCVVFNKTELYEMTKSGAYSPLSVDEAAERCCAVYGELRKGKVKVLRIGLQASEALSDDKEVCAGANHPAMGELVISRYFYGLMSRAIRTYRDSSDSGYKGKQFMIECNRSNLSQVIGQKKKNKEMILKEALEAGFSGIKILQNDNIQKDNLYMHFN